MQAISKNQLPIKKILSNRSRKLIFWTVSPSAQKSVEFNNLLIQVFQSVSFKDLGVRDCSELCDRVDSIFEYHHQNQISCSITSIGCFEGFAGLSRIKTELIVQLLEFVHHSTVERSMYV